MHYRYDHGDLIKDIFKYEMIFIGGDMNEQKIVKEHCKCAYCHKMTNGHGQLLFYLLNECEMFNVSTKSEILVF